MKYYSSKIFLSFLVVNILSAIFVFLVVFLEFLWDGLKTQLILTNPDFVYYLFLFVIPLPSIIFSTLIILLQQKGFRRSGYFMILLVIAYFFYVPYLYQFLHFGFSEPIPQRFIIDFVAMILLLVAIIPFYVLGRLVKEDFFNKRIAKR